MYYKQFLRTIKYYGFTDKPKSTRKYLLDVPKGNFGIKQECTEKPFWHIYRGVWAEGPFSLDNIGWSDVMFFTKISSYQTDFC